MQRILREAFVGSTLLCIAHRLVTVIDFDKILVMDGGRKRDFAQATELLADPRSLLSRMVDSGPPELRQQLLAKLASARAASVYRVTATGMMCDFLKPPLDSTLHRRPTNPVPCGTRPDHAGH